MFSDEFIKDFEAYGKDSEVCKRAFEQLKRTIEQEKSKKKFEDLEKARKETDEKIATYEAEASAIEYILRHEEKCLSQSTKNELSILKNKIEEDVVMLKNKMKAMKKDFKKEDMATMALLDLFGII